ncbi:hypothetical protein JYK22_13685, partial [Nonomuraea sp. RK-328]|nr:hypothetical protein [Nonomuraea sp. RK-328]
MDPSADVRALRLPFDAYKRTEADIERIQRAADVLVGRCLEEQGYRPRPARPAVAMVEAPNRRRYGVMEPEVAARAGYRAPRTSAETERDRADRERGGYRNAMERTAGHRCLQAAMDRLHVTGVDSPVLARLEREIFEQTRTKDAGVASALTAWRSCMRVRGQKEYADPLAAAADERWKDPGAAKAETAAAAADVACKKETGLVEVWRRAEDRLQSAALQQHAADFAQVGQALEKERAEASRLVRSGA